MFTFHPTQHTAALLAVVLALSSTGCSSTRDHAALTSLRSFTLSSRPASFASATARTVVAVHRHAREHALTADRTAPTPHHGTPRSL